MLIISADHGCDPKSEGSDHTREYIPILIYGKKIKPNVNLGIRKTFADIGATISDMLRCGLPDCGKSMLLEIIKSI